MKAHPTEVNESLCVSRDGLGMLVLGEEDLIIMVLLTLFKGSPVLDKESESGATKNS